MGVIQFTSIPPNEIGIYGWNRAKNDGWRRANRGWKWTFVQRWAHVSFACFLLLPSRPFVSFRVLRGEPNPSPPAPTTLASVVFPCDHRHDHHRIWYSFVHRKRLLDEELLTAATKDLRRREGFTSKLWRSISSRVLDPTRAAWSACCCTSGEERSMYVGWTIGV